MRKGEKRRFGDAGEGVSELDVEFLKFVGLGFRRADPFVHEGMRHDGAAVADGGLIQRDVISDETRTDRGVHGIGAAGMLAE